MADVMSYVKWWGRCDVIPKVVWADVMSYVKWRGSCDVVRKVNGQMRSRSQRGGPKTRTYVHKSVFVTVTTSDPP